MILDCKGKYGKFLQLGVQTSKGNVQDRAISLAHNWSPKRAKSFTITKLIHTDYHGRPEKDETGYATIHVEYYSTKKEGEHLV